MVDSVENVLRKKHPTLGKKCDYEGGRAAAIRIMCLSCMGGESDAKTLVKHCKSYTCPLWRYRLGSGSTTIPAGKVPSKAQYDAMIGD